MSGSENVAELCSIVRRLSSDMADLNSRYPATQEFLRARGLKNVRQLDKNGRKELREHLEKTLFSLSN